MVTATFAPPRVHLIPSASNSLADDVYEMAELVGFEFDPWQHIPVDGGTGTRPDGKWAAKRVGINVPRQNGKGGILELIELTALFTWLPQYAKLWPGSHGERLVIHSAHEYVTSEKHFDRIWSLVENTPELLKRVVRQRRIGTHGREGWKTVDGCAIEFRTRTKASGRGFSCDLLILDEAMFLPEESLGALLPTLRARPNPQIWYTGSAVDQDVHNEGLVWTRLRCDALEQKPELAYFEWSLDYDHPEEMPEDEFDSEEAMWRSNPAFGIRIFPEHFHMENDALDRRTAAVELYGVGDYPDPTGSEERPISPEQWMELATDEDSQITGPVCFAFDVSPERRTSIAAAGKNADGHWQVEVIEKLPGTGWLASRLYDLVEQHDAELVVCDKIGPGASLIAKLDEIGVAVKGLDSSEHAQACGMFVDAVNEQTLRHLGSLDLLNAIRAAKTRSLGDRWAWSRKGSSVDISPLVAATLALWAAMGQPDTDDDYWRIY